MQENRFNENNNYIVFLTEFPSLSSFLIKLYLILKGEFSAFPVTHVCIYYNRSFYDLSSDGVGEYSINEEFIRRIFYLIPIPSTAISGRWVISAVTHLHLIGTRSTHFGFLCYPFTKVKPLTCTGLVQHLLMFDVTNPTPKELKEQFEHEWNYREERAMS